MAKFRYLGMEDLQQEFLVENPSINVEFWENITGEITAGAYVIIVWEIVNVVQQIEAGALLVPNKYNVALIWANESIYPFDSHSKDENGNLLSSGTAVFVKFGTLCSLENDLKSVYYITFPLTLYF